ncbi:hypothetical protein KCP77_06705 [Salmonella enterica subsp. enterica]|nr:hypothetical protein KCP77_06705 [Salmonella enterica subsp. enterica]
MTSLPDVERLPELITSRSRILALGQMSNMWAAARISQNALSAPLTQREWS